MDKSYNMIESIYEDYTHVHGDYDLEESKAARRAFDEYLENLDIDNNKKIELDNRIVAVICAFERQGFYHGLAAGLELSRQLDNVSQVAQ